jgi:hypothetical protein
VACWLCTCMQCRVRFHAVAYLYCGHSTHLPLAVRVQLVAACFDTLTAGQRCHQLYSPLRAKAKNFPETYLATSAITDAWLSRGQEHVMAVHAASFWCRPLLCACSTAAGIPCQVRTVMTCG